jgi:D-cysteine desulfhydrase
VARLDHLGRSLDSEVWIKRDDLSGPTYGGNKVRKLEHLLADVQADGGRSVLTAGGVGSNHVVATGVYARVLGLAARAVVVPQPITDQVHRNLALARALDVELLPCAARPLVPLCISAARLQPGCRVVGPGGSSPLGTLGYVSAALELQEQIEAGLLPCPDEIYIALGSGGSAAGLALGCALAGLRCRIVGVRVVERVLINETLTRLLIRLTRRLLEVKQGAPPARLEVVHGYLGSCYGDPTPQAERARRLVADSEGVKLETTYTAKAMAALIDRCRRRPGRTVLYWNTYNSRDMTALERQGAPRPLPDRIQRWLDAG